MTSLHLETPSYPSSSLSSYRSAFRRIITLNVPERVLPRVSTLYRFVRRGVDHFAPSRCRESYPYSDSTSLRSSRKYKTRGFSFVSFRPIKGLTSDDSQLPAVAINRGSCLIYNCGVVFPRNYLENRRSIENVRLTCCFFAHLSSA